MTTDTSKDILQKFIFDNAAVRGELIEVSNAWREIQSRHDYPKAVRNLLGEMVAAAALLSANLKFNGAIVMQIHRRRPGQAAGGRVRRRPAPARHRQAGARRRGRRRRHRRPQLLNQHGRGRFVITLDPQDKVPGQQPYQGVVPLIGDDIATIIENYMLRSEQMDTRLWLAADDNVARGLLLQKLPRNSASKARSPRPPRKKTWKPGPAPPCWARP